MPGALVAILRGSDAISVDDSAPVLAEAAAGSIAVVVDAVDEIAATGGAPVVEQALLALQLDITIRPLPQVPDRADDLGAFVGILIDDPPGFTPEERHTLSVFVEHGGVVLVTLGPRAAVAPLGASLEPFLHHAVAWEETSVPGVAPETASGALAASAASLIDLGAKHRSRLDATDIAQFVSLLEWKDHQPLVLHRAIGRGEVWVVTLPFALDASDLPVRPAFLALLDAWTEAARARRVPKRGDVGAAWTLTGASHVTVTGAGRGKRFWSFATEASRERHLPGLGSTRSKPMGAGRMRVAAPVEREVDLRPRRLAVSGGGARAVGDTRATIDASPAIAALDALAGDRRALFSCARRAQGGGRVTHSSAVTTESSSQRRELRLHSAPCASDRLSSSRSLAVTACAGAGPYGHSAQYAPLSSEERAANGSKDYDPVMVQRQPDAWHAALVSLFGVVVARLAGAWQEARISR